MDGAWLERQTDAAMQDVASLECRSRSHRYASFPEPLSRRFALLLDGHSAIADLFGAVVVV